MHEDALGPNDTGFDDLALWTGSVARGDDGVWRLYYTALNTEGGGVKDQRIGLAESDDLMTWRRVASEPLVEPDPCHYRMVRRRLERDLARPVRLPRRRRLAHADHRARPDRRAAVRRRAGPRPQRRHAHWELAPPLTEPAQFGQLEVSQVRCVDGQWLLLFTCHPDEQGERTPFCTWYVLGDSPLGPWDIATARPFEDEPNLFAAPLVQRRDGSWCFLGFIDRASFDIVDPIPVELRDGTLRRSAPGP